MLGHEGLYRRLLGDDPEGLGVLQCHGLLALQIARLNSLRQTPIAATIKGKYLRRLGYSLPRACFWPSFAALSSAAQLLLEHELRAR